MKTQNLDYKTIIEKLRGYIKDNFASADETDIGDNDSLLRLGIIDSLSLVSIISYIEEEFDIEVSPKDFFPGKFDTIEKAAGYILDYHERKKA